MREGFRKRLKPVTSILLICILILMQLSVAGASTEKWADSTTLSLDDHILNESEPVKATSSNFDRATPSESQEDDFVMEEDIIQDDKWIPYDETWDGYVMENSEALLATPSEFLKDAISEPQSVDMSVETIDTFRSVEVQTISSAARATNTIKRYSVLVLDISGSMGGVPIERTRQAAIKFCDQVLSASGENYVAVVSFSGSAKVVHDFSDDFDSLSGAIGRMQVFWQGTSQYAGLECANDLLSSVSEPDAIKSVLLMSDGLPESGLSADRGPYKPSDYHGYGYANAAYAKAELMKEDYFIYSLGFFHLLSGENLEFGRRFMGGLQNAGYYEVVNPDDLEFEFGEIAGDILSQSGTFRYAGTFISSHDVEATYHYSDSYFLKESFEYNPMLSTMSLCLELASWSSFDTSVWPDKTRNARELLTGSEGIGFKEFAQNEFWNERPTRDSIGVVAANKVITDYKDGKKEYTLIALAIRGGGYGSEWASNFTLGESGTHAGFTLARSNVLKFLKEYIEKYQITGDIKLWVVGYSRAGGTANMVGGALNDGYALPNVTLRKSDLFVYTFEAPQGTLKELAERGGASRYANIHNVINWNDSVPLVAPFQWGFVRYNRRQDIRLPYAMQTADFSSYLSEMLTEFYKLEGASEHGYRVREYSTKDNFMIDWSKILPGGDPFIWWEESMIPQYDVLSSTVDFLSKDILKSRSHYYHNFEDGVREIFDALYDESGRAKIFWEEFSSGGNLLKIMAPLFNTNPYYTFDRKMRDIRSNINRSVRKAAEEAELDVTDEFIDAMDELIGDLVEQLALEVIDNNTDNINLILKMSDLISQGSVGQAHYPEVCLAWLMSFDENYNKDASTFTTPGAFRIIRINCPVDVNVYDDEGFLTASIIDGQRQDVEGGIIGFLNDKGEKILYLPADGSYRIDLEATGDGEMTYSINEVDLIENSVSRLVNYYSIPLTAGDTFTGFADAFADDEMGGGLPDGSSVRYQLLDSSSNEITVSEEITGAEVANNYYKVAVVADNDSGYVNGTGTFIKGSFAKVTASPLSGSHLIGWYDGNRLVSTDLVYRFAVKEDMRLTARFAPVTRHALKLEAGGGGAITSVEGFYTVGTQIAVVAEPDAGYVFKGWTSSDNAGEFEDNTDGYTFFIMPDHEVKVTAHFEPVNPIWHTVTVTAGAGGVVSGGGRFLLDTQVTLTAVPDTGFTFDGWYENNGELVNTGDVYTFLITEDRVLEARFRMEEENGPAEPDNPHIPEKPDETNVSEDDNTASEPPVIPETPGTWNKTEDGWQFLGADGIPYRETWIYVSGKWYWIEASAMMAEGWREIQGKRYYLLPVDGAMMTGWHQVEEIWYYFDEKTGMCAG